MAYHDAVAVGLVVLVALAGLYSLAESYEVSPLGGPSAWAIVGVPSQLGDTVVIAGLNLNEAVGTDVSSLTDLHLASLRDGASSTLEGVTVYRQTMRFSQTGTDAFSGGVVRFGQDDAGRVGDYLVFNYGNPIVEYELVFGQGLSSRVEQGDLPGFEDVTISFMGRPATIYRASLSGNALELRMFTPGGDVQVRDADVTDNAFERGVKINGRTVNSQVRIRASASSGRVTINEIHYRVLSYPRFGGDLYVQPKRGVRQYLSEPEVLVNPSFDVIYGGIRGSAGSVQGAPSAGAVLLDPAGGQRYDLTFTNLAGQTIKAPLVTLVSGTPTLGNGKQDLVVSEGSSTSDFNIDVGDYFIATSANDVNGVTNVVVYSGLSRTDQTLFFDILGKGRTQARYDEGTGRARLYVGGFTFDVYVDLGSTERIVVDQNNDGSFSGATARIVTKGGAQITPGASSLIVRIASRLFENPPSSDETTTINIAADGSKITASVPSQSSVTLRQANDRISRGMTPYGVHFTLDDRRVPSTLSIDVPITQRAAKASVSSRALASRSQVGRMSKGAQVWAFVIVTMERERFLPSGSRTAAGVGASGAGVGVND